jgi:trehalose 6-phosphate phosphatase
MQSAPVLDAPPALATLLERGEVALFLDFDGTLVEIAEGPDAIEPRAGLAESLQELSQRLCGRCAIVSGRAIRDIEKHLGPLGVAVAGSHGSDIRSADGAALGAGARSLPAEMEAALRAFAEEQGLDYEDKPHGGALHYRRNPGQGEQALAFAQDLAETHGWAVQSGKCVVELVAGEGDKGSAVRTLMETPGFAGARPFFIGDDLTDEAGFDACAALGGGGVLVGDPRETSARYHLPGVAAVHDWLEL